MSASPLVTGEKRESSRVFTDAQYRRMKSSYKSANVKLGSNSLQVKFADKDKVVDRVWYSDFKAIKVVVAGGTVSHELEVDIRGGSILHLAAHSSEERDRWVSALCKAYKRSKEQQKQ